MQNARKQNLYLRGDSSVDLFLVTFRAKKIQGNFHALFCLFNFALDKLWIFLEQVCNSARITSLILRELVHKERQNKFRGINIRDLATQRSSFAKLMFPNIGHNAISRLN